MDVAGRGSLAAIAVLETDVPWGTWCWKRPHIAEESGCGEQKDCPRKSDGETFQGYLL